MKQWSEKDIPQILEWLSKRKQSWLERLFILPVEKRFMTKGWKWYPLLIMLHFIQARKKSLFIWFFYLGSALTVIQIIIRGRMKIMSFVWEWGIAFIVVWGIAFVIGYLLGRSITNHLEQKGGENE